ncbi:YdcF family protein [Ructibacterium gallinarum]|uniref:YdcF family protein n=1 Tax=Ructibacterium gallinarum TaxID=2779355 RepID=A0A9D5M5F4_9FIRM|nr:YdcF family protein [Ructibacterium gallinarum]MBE5039874.1 YdcF family protein [Ructibacterium gallinarum]
MKQGVFAALALVLLAGVLAVFWIGGVIMGRSGTDSYTGGAPVDYVIILGCRLDGREPGRCLEERVKTAAEYLRKHPFAMAVCSGGQGEDEEISEAEAIANALKKRGISAGRIILEDQSHSTYENFQKSKEILDRRKGGEPYQVSFVTNDFHVYRSRLLAEEIGFSSPAAVSAKTPASLYYTNLLREIAAVAATWCGYR